MNEAKLRDKAQAVGFELCGISAADEATHANYFKSWLQAGWHGDMHWMEKDISRRINPAHVLPGAQSIILLGLNYFQAHPQQRGKTARYALGYDYHDFMKPMMEELAAWLSYLGGTQKCYVDTGPILEKNLAARTGIGWQGKNTLLIHPKGGCWYMLGCILTTLKLTPDLPETDHCGTCTRCINACPTGAIVEPYQLDARRCLAYYSIEHKGPIPVEFREAMGDRVYGCDDCLAVCPWNRFAQTTKLAGLSPLSLPDLREMLLWEKETFNRVFKHSPIKRLKLARWKRNICVVLGNIGTRDDLSILKTLSLHEDSLISEHATWAVQRIQARC